MRFFEPTKACIKYVLLFMLLIQILFLITLASASASPDFKKLYPSTVESNPAGVVLTSEVNTSDNNYGVVANPGGGMWINVTSWTETIPSGKIINNVTAYIQHYERDWYDSDARFQYSTDEGGSWTECLDLIDNQTRKNESCNLTSVLNTPYLVNNAQLKYYVYDLDGAGKEYGHVDVIYMNVTFSPDTEPPKRYDQGQDVSDLHKGESINLSTRWTDTGGLKNATLAHNGTGAWQNVSTIALSGMQDWSNFTLSTELLDFTPGIIGWKIYANDTANNENVTANMTFELWGWSNVTWDSPLDGSSYEVGDTITLTCLVQDANSSTGIQNYPVRFYNKTDSTVTYIGLNYTNNSGYAVKDWDTTGVAAGWYYPMCNITDNATLFYNISAPYEANTSIELSYATILEIKNQTNVTPINSINFSGVSGDTVSDPWNNEDEPDSKQNISTTTPVATIFNPSPSTKYRIWLKVTKGTNWDNIISNEKFNVTDYGVSPGDVSTWTKSLTPWDNPVDSGVNVSAGTNKTLYLAFYLKGSGTGNSTLSVLGEGKV